MAISLWAEIVRSKQIAIPEGQYRNIFRFPREAWPALEGTGSELHRLTCIRNHFPKKKEVVMSRDWRHFSLSWNRPSTFFAVFRQKCTLGGLFVLQASSSSQNDYYISSTISFLDSTFSDWITLPRFHPRRSAVLVAETRERRQALVKSRASTHVDNSIHPLTQEISRVYDSSVERPPSPIEQIPPLLLLSPYG